MAIQLIIPGGAVQLSGNPVLIKATGAEAPVATTDYKVLLRVTSNDGQLRGGPFLDAITPDDDGAVTFNISRLVDKPHIPLFEFPLLTASYGYINAAWNITIELGETYIDSTGARIIHYHADDALLPEAQLMQVIKGGISDHQIGIYNAANTTFFQQIIVKGRFLTNQPATIKVGINQPVKLFLISPYSNNQFIDVITTAYYADGSTQDFTENSELYVDGMFEYTMHPAHVGLPLNKSGSKLVRYTIGWGNPATVGDLREYIIDYTPHEYETYVWFGNSLAGVDIIRFTGSVKRSIDISLTEGVQAIDDNSLPSTPEILTTSVFGRKKFTLNTGYKSAAEIEALEDLYLSRNIWIQINNQLYPVNLENGDRLLFDSDDDTPYRELAFRSAYNKKFK